LACDVEEIRRKGNIFGLQLNVKKFEFIIESAISSNSTFSNFIHLNVEEADLLGAPLTVGTARTRRYHAGVTILPGQLQHWARLPHTMH